MSLQSDILHRIQAIEELATLLYHGTELDSPAIEWFQSWKNNKEKYLELYEADVFVRGSGIVPKLLHVLRECLLSKQWDKAVLVLTSVSKAPIGTSQPVWKCGLELLQSDTDDENQDLIRNLYNQMKYLCDLNCHEVVLDYLLYLLKKGDIETAKEALQENIVRPGKEPADRDCYITTLFRAYCGLVWYVEWKQCRHSLEQLKSSEEQETDSLMMSSQSSTVFLEMQMKSYSQKALACFQTLESKPGVWDIFIRKQVELLVYSERLDDALNILTDYRDTNPDNPNAIKYLYNFYKENCSDSEHTPTLLKDIVRRLPADPLVLEYCSTVRDGNESMVLPLLFKLLDYPCWQNELQPWKMLAECLKKMALRTAEDLSVIKGCWDPYKSWWPQYHFNKHMVMKEDNKFGINFFKALVAGLLCGADNVLVREVQARLKPDELDELGKVFEHCHTGIT